MPPVGSWQGTPPLVSRRDMVTPDHVRTRTEDTPRTSPQPEHTSGDTDTCTRTREREHMTGTDTSMGHVTCVTTGYLYQSWMENGISPEPELYKCNTIPILVNIAKIVLTSWISFLRNVVTI